jgi:hypothetical protein
MKVNFLAAMHNAIAFFRTPASPVSFITLRLGIALALLVRALVEFDILLDLYGNNGLIPWGISEFRPIGWLPNMSWASYHLSHLGIGEDGSVYLIFTIYVIALLGMLVGFRTRIFSIVAWLTHLILFESASFSSYGVDSFINIALFYCVIMPKGATVPLHRLFSRWDFEQTVIAGTLLRLIQIHMCVVYLTSGIEKARGEQWWNGEAIWRSVMQPQFYVFDMSWLADFPFLATTLSLVTLALEIGYTFLIWPRRTRHFCLAAIVSMHMGIVMILGLHFFGVILIILNLAAFGSGVIESANLRVSRLLFTHRGMASNPIARSATE